MANHGTMVSFDDAIEIIEELDFQIDTKMRVLNRMRYERDKAIPVPVNRTPMRYGHSYICSCGNCGYGGIEIHEKYCPNCGYKTKW